MTNRVLLFVLCVISTVSYAQEDEREKAFRERAATLKQDTTKPFGWTHKAVAGVNLTEVAFKDWAQGGQNALAYTLLLNGSSTQDMEKTNWSTGYRLAFGQARLSDQGLRKTDDEIFLESLLIYKLWTYINPYASFIARTQFAPGFEYPQGTEVEVSRFFDPASFTQSFGAAYKPIPEVVTRLGIGVREVVASRFAAIYTDDPSTPDTEKVKVRGGIESVTNVEWTFAENMQFKAGLELFAPFKTLDQIIVRSDNSITASVNKYVTVGVNVQLINDVTTTRRTQIKQVLAIGLTYTLL